MKRYLALVLLPLVGCTSATVVQKTDSFRELKLRKRSRVDLVMFQRERGEYSGFNALHPMYYYRYDNSASEFNRFLGVWPLLSWYKFKKEDQKKVLNVVGIGSPFNDDPVSNFPLSVFHWLSRGEKAHAAFFTPLGIDYRTNGDVSAVNLLGFGNLDFEGEGFFPFSLFYYLWSGEEKRLAVGTPLIFDVRRVKKDTSHFHILGIDDVTGGYFEDPYPLAALRVESTPDTNRVTVGFPFLFSYKKNKWGIVWNLGGLPFSLNKEENPGDGTYVSLLGYARGPHANHLHVLWPLTLSYENEMRGESICRFFPLWNYTKRPGREVLTVFPLLSTFETTPEGKFFRPLFFMRFKMHAK